MADIDLTDLAGDEVVFHFGGRPNEVDAYTFANSLLAFSEAIREINRQINPDSKLEITIEGIGEGSFRAKLRTTTTFLSSLLQSTASKELARNLLLPLFVAFVYGKYLADDTKIIITDDSYIVQRGHDRIILPKAVYDKKREIRDPSVIDRNIAKGFEVLNEDPSVSDFGITKRLDDKRPLASIPRDDFGILSRAGGIVTSELDARERYEEKPERLIVLRAILARSTRKWQFVWNGIKISAPIIDESFYDALARHEYEFGQGDILDVMLRIHQKRDDDTGVYINTGFYEVITVYGRSPGPRQGSFLPPR